MRRKKELLHVTGVLLCISVARLVACLFYDSDSSRCLDLLGSFSVFVASPWTKRRLSGAGILSATPGLERLKTKQNRTEAERKKEGGGGPAEPLREGCQQDKIGGGSAIGGRDASNQERRKSKKDETGSLTVFISDSAAAGRRGEYVDEWRCDKHGG